MNYETLKAGDVRQEGDEIRRRYDVGESSSRIPQRYADRFPEEFKWTKVNLLNCVILQSDLISHEFRRPLT